MNEPFRTLDEKIQLIRKIICDNYDRFYCVTPCFAITFSSNKEGCVTNISIQDEDGLYLVWGDENTPIIGESASGFEMAVNNLLFNLRRRVVVV